MSTASVPQTTTAPKGEPKPPTPKQPGTSKTASPATPDLTGLQVAALTEKELLKLTTHLVRLKEKRKKAMAQLKAAERDLQDVHRQVRLLLQGATALDARGAGELAASDPTPMDGGAA